LFREPLLQVRSPRIKRTLLSFRWPCLGGAGQRYGKYKTVHKRFTRWAARGVWERVFALMVADRHNDYLLIDSTIVRAHQQAVTGKGGAKIRRWGVPEGD
ncbi:putative transposase of IS4/5 family DUF4096, partial [Crenobacter luteus]